MYTHIRSANYVFSHYLPLWFIVFGHFALSSETLFNLTYLIVATTRTYIFIIWILNVFFAYWAPVQAHFTPPKSLSNAVLYCIGGQLSPKALMRLPQYGSPESTRRRKAARSSQLSPSKASTEKGSCGQSPTSVLRSAIRALSESESFLASTGLKPSAEIGRVACLIRREFPLPLLESVSCRSSKWSSDW